MGSSKRLGPKAGRQLLGTKNKPGSKARLRTTYKGWCPLRDDLSLVGSAVEERELSELTPEIFYKEFVSPRKPVKLKAAAAAEAPLALLFGLRGEAAKWTLPGAAGTAALRDGPAGTCSVVAEFRKSARSMFGQEDAKDRRTTTLAEFCKDLESGSELGYLSTQQLPEDEDGCPIALAAPHVQKLLAPAERLRPELLGSLVPLQYNIWFGRTADGSSSGLHHDFHDNIYAVLRGGKEFRLFSPRCIDFLDLAGAKRTRPQVHANGLISYGTGIRDDGAPESIVRSWKRKAAGEPGNHAGALAMDDSDDEAMLEDALNLAMEGEESEDGGPSTGVPDSFSRFSTVGTIAADLVHSSNVTPVPKELAGKHLTARLQAGDLLYLPASWFHEVLSRGGDAGGHLAFNLWIAPPNSTGSFSRPYEDGFWEEKFQAMCRDFGATSPADVTVSAHRKLALKAAFARICRLGRRRRLLRIRKSQAHGLART
eukprot:TRINITY_DN114719_c0_g1_i1.p1 TRINITY_DN114719_c0_g1~~TRINITY_DN114719_c0_g1_i1.p1  ORF type:complete len:513 (+),score=58.83 TRINITY_DN114719_c0_g1_i1:93-1541(+)